MTPTVLNELRLLSSARFDSRILLTVVLAGDARLTEKLRLEELLPLGSRIRVRLALEAATPEELLACLRHLSAQAGNAKLMTVGLMQTLSEHALGNRRVLVNTAARNLSMKVRHSRDEIRVAPATESGPPARRQRCFRV